LVVMFTIGKDGHLMEVFLVGLAFLSPPLVEVILQGRQPVDLTATRLTELDLPLDWTEQHKLLAS
jgi:site-specific DNA recombinase